MLLEGGWGAEMWGSLAFSLQPGQPPGTPSPGRGPRFPELAGRRPPLSSEAAAGRPCSVLPLSRSFPGVGKRERPRLPAGAGWGQPPSLPWGQEGTRQKASPPCMPGTHVPIGPNNLPRARGRERRLRLPWGARGFNDFSDALRRSSGPHLALVWNQKAACLA